MVSAGILAHATERIDIRSTVPVNGPMVTRSPVFIPFSNWIKMPVIISFTSVWAPNEMASPSAPAPASSGAIFTPTSESRIIAVMVLIMTASALRNNVSSVRARAPVAGGREYLRPGGFLSAGEQRPADGGEEQNQRDANQHIHRFLPGAVLHPVPEIKQSPGA